MTTYNYQGTPIQGPVSIISRQDIFASDTLAQGQQYSANTSQRWEVSFSVLPENAMAFFRQSVVDIAGTVTMTMPQTYESGSSSHTFTGTATCAATAAGSTTVAFTTAAGNNGQALMGDYFIKFSNHDKVYLLTADTTVAAGAGTLSIFPRLTTAVTTLHTVVYSPASVILTARRSITNLRGMTFSDGKLADPGTITLMEAV